MGNYKIVILVLASFTGYSQTINRYFITFKDKTNTPYSISNPSQFLSAKSMARRERENFLISIEDLPVDPNYIAQIKSTGVSVFFSSRWFNGVLVQMDETMIATITALPFVSKVELVAHDKKLLGGRKWAGKSESSSSGLSNQLQLEMLALDKMHALGYFGDGVDVAILDAGFIGVNTASPFQHLYQEGRIKDVKNFVTNTDDVYSAYDHGTWVLSVMAAYEGNLYEGGAYKANYFLYQTEDVYSEFRIEEYNWAFAAERADSAGVDVINSSLGYNLFDDSSMDYHYSDMDGKTTVISRAARKAVERGIAVVVAAGNEGATSWRYITAPADANGVIACGSVDSFLNKSPTSSFGPSYDGRIKPDLSGLGSGSSVILSSGYVGSVSGTSLASPLIASLVTGMRQVFPLASALQVRSLLIASASLSSNPDTNLGYGIPNFIYALSLADLKDAFIVSPNPVIHDEAKIFFKEVSDKPVSVAILNSTGQEIGFLQFMLSWENNPVRIDFSSFSNPGIYFLKIQTSTVSMITKVLLIK